jgi:LysM repeat protein
MPQSSTSKCAEVLKLLEDAVQGPAGEQTLTLDAALLPAAGVLIGYLQLDTLTIHQKDASTPLVEGGAPEACALITGTVVLFPAAPAGSTPFVYDVVIQVNAVSDEVTMLLEATPTSLTGWMFGANFIDLPPYIGLSGVTLKTLESFYYSMSVKSPVFWIAIEEEPSHALGLSFEGMADLTVGALRVISKYFPDPTKIPVGGAIEMRKNSFPLIALTGKLGSYSVPSITDTSLEFGTADATTGANAQPALSTLDMVGISVIQGFPPFRLSAPLLQSTSTWIITGELVDKEKYPLTRMLSAMVSYAGGSNLPLPSGMDTDGFFLDSVSVAIKPAVNPTITMVGFTVASPAAKSWTAPIFGLTISDLSVEWQVLNPFSSAQMSGTIYGVLRFGEAPDTSRLQIEVDLSGITTSTAPDVSMSAALDPKYPVSLATLFSQLTGLEIDIDLNLTMLLFEAETGPRTLQFSATLEGKWPFPVPLIEFGETNFLFQYTPNSISGSVSVIVTIVTFKFMVSAAYTSGGRGWDFAGHLAPDSQNNTLQAFINAITDEKYPALPANLGAIVLRKLDIAFSTGSGAFSFDGVVAWPFTFDKVFDLTIEAELSLNSPGVSKDGTRKYGGFVRGSLQVNAFRFSVIYRFDIQKNTSVNFIFNYRGATLTCTYAKKGEESILTANLGGVTFGSILNFLVNLVDPNVNFSLSSPWDVLYDISFDNLILTVNLATKAVGISYKVGANLGLINIDTIGLTYVTRAGRSTVMMSLTGRFFDQDYKDDPLAWDLLNDPPPTAAGTGEKLLDLRYVGIGQNVGFRSATNFTNVQSVLQAMESDFLPVKSEDKNPLDSPLLANLQFAGDGRWLIGADFTLMEAISLSVVFNDPTLYGLRIALAGEKVKSLSGLDFQILYKKVTDTIGVYHIELTLPQAFRQFNLGAVAVTMSIIVVDVYTNGNFRVDFGFPVGTDFSRSFCLQAGPFIGYGGFYFALLDGSTSTRVPRITNGTFSPVIEAGLALSVGLGRTIDKGIFKAGATITIVGILQGAFGWFNPNDNSSPSAQYYWIQGTVALVGMLFGSVDFVVISAEVSLTLKATLTMTFEAYKAVEVRATFEVTASASVKILFFRVSFSFSMTLEIAFTIGSSSTPPWLIEAPAPPPLALRQQNAWKTPRLSAMYLQRSLIAMIGVDSGSFDWKPAKVFAQIQAVKLSMMPALTVALPKLTLAAAHTNTTGGPEPQAVMALFVPNTVPGGTQSSKSLLRVTQAAPEANPFNLLCMGMLRWSLGSYTRPPALGVGGSVLATDLEAIEQYLGEPANWQQAFTADALFELMALNYQLQISTPMGPTGVFHPDLGLLAEAASADEVSYMVFPMLPQLQVAYGTLPPVIYGEHNPVTLDWEQALGTYLGQMRSSAADSADASAAAAKRKGDGPVGLAASGPESLSTFVFRDYFAMLTKGVVQSAADLMKAYPFEVSAPTGPSGPGPDSLNSIAAQFQAPPISYRTRQGDTLARVAARFGVHPTEVHELNPHLLTASASVSLEVGTELLVAASVTAVSITENNADYPLNYIPGVPVSMPVTGVKCQVRAGTGSASESLSAIAHRFGIADGTTIFTEGGANNVNAINRQLLQAGAVLTIPAITATGFATKKLCAAFYFVRNVGPAVSGQTPWYPDLNWYQQWISTENGDHTDPTVPWKVPIVQLVDGVLAQSDETTYIQRGGNGTAMDGDTIAQIAGYFAMVQLQPAPYTEEYASFLGTVTPGSGGNFNLPAFQHVVRAGESLSSIACTFGVSVAKLVQPNAGTQGLLQLLAVLALPKLNYVIRRDDTLASVAANLDLTIEDLALSVRATPGIFLPYVTTKTRLSIPDVPARDADKLIADLVKFGSFNNVSGMVASFLMHGMRVPEPKAPIVDKTFPASTPLWGLYELAGQQFPTRGVSGPSGIDAVFKQQSVPWIRFDAASPSGPTGLPELVVHMDNGFLSNTPAPVLYPNILAGPASLPLYREAAQQYSFLQTISWQAPGVLNFPGPSGVTGPSGQVQPQPAQPTLWIFPPAMQMLTAGASGPASVTPAYDLLLQSSDNSTTTQETPLKKFVWAMAVDVTIQQAQAAPRPMANSYVVVGADQSGRKELLKAWTYLESSRTDGALYLLYSPSATSTNSKGLASAIADPTQTFLLKSNLTTVTRSNQSLRAAATVSNYDYSAPLSATSSFLKLLWEASVTGSNGFYLNYSNKNGGTGLPTELFSNGTTAVLTVLLVAGDQQRSSGPQRGLFPFNNCALVGENIDPKSATLFARLAKPGSQDLQRISTAAAGTVGFYMARKNPDPPSASSAAVLSPEDTSRSLYSLLGFQLNETSGFKESNQGLPIGSSETPASGVSGPTGQDVWWYQQKVPVAQFAKANQAPPIIAVPSLPQAADNPYAGIIGPTGITGPASLSSISVALSFNDVYGNQTAVGMTVGPISIPIGYTDEVIGLSIWPGIGLDFVFHPGVSGRVQLESELTMQTNRYLPSGAYPFDQAHKAAVADKKRYEQIYFQVQQHDLNFAFDINLGQTLIGQESLKAAIAGFVTKANAFLHTVQSLEEHQYPTVDGDTMSGISDTFSVTPEMLVAANPDQFVQALFKGQMVQPVLTTATPMNSLQALVQGQESKPSKPVCPDTTLLNGGTKLTAGKSDVWISGLRFGHTPMPVAPKSPKMLVTPLTVAELSEKNANAPLTPGNLLIIQPTVSSAPFSTKDTMATIAKSLECAVYAVSSNGSQDGDVFVGLYVDNFKIAGIVTPNLDITIGGMTNSTGAAPTLESVETSFAGLNWSKGDFVQNLQTVPGLFLLNAKLIYATFYVPQPVATSTTTALPVYALASLPSSAGTIAWLANANANVINFFYTGTPIYLGYHCYSPKQFDTFASLATDFGVTLAQLAQFNQWVVCKAGQELAIPSLVKLLSILGQDATVTPLSTDSLVSIAELNGISGSAQTNALAIAVTNQYLPGIFADGASITLSGKTIPIAPMDSLNDVAEKFELPFEPFVEQIMAIKGLYRTNGAILIPIPSVPPTDPSRSPEEWKSLSWNELATRYRVQASGGQSATERLIETNRCLEGFLLKGAEIAGPPAYKPLEVGVYDTIETLLRKFAAQGKAAPPPTVTDLIEFNGNTEGLLAMSSAFLLPPNPCAVETAVAPAVPPPGKSSEDAIVFPVTVTMKMMRNPQLMAPEFASTQAVYRSISTFSPRGWSTNSTSLDLTDFAAEFESAFAPYQLKCAVSQVSSGVGKEARALWEVNFGKGGVSTLAVEANAPSFYAMAPLSTQLLGGDVWVNSYKQDCGLCTPVLKKFDSVDLDGWMQQFLSAVDLVLTPPYAVPAFQQVPGGLTGSVASAGPLPFAEMVRLDSASDFAGAFATGPTGCAGCTGGTAINGPANFESIVNSKLTLAKQLSTRVMPILQGAGATGNYYGAVAQETLYQQMLVELSSAYSVDAIIQYPVDVVSPCVVPLPPVGPSAQIPPRISGDVTLALETVPGTANDTNTLRASAMGSGVSVPYFALVLRAVQGLLFEGAKVTYSGNVYTIAYNETFDTLTQQFGENISPDHWTLWTEFFTAIQDQEILLSGATLPMVRISRVVGTDATIEGIAAFFGVDAGSVGQANQHIPDILRANTTISIDGHEKYVVKAGQTLLDIAGQMHPPISVALLATGIGSTPGILTDKKTFFLAQSLPDVTFSTTKVDLGRVGSSSGLAPALSFLFSVKHPRQYKNLFLNLKYVVRELEYGISTVSGTDGYQDSSWLTFLLPFGSEKGLDFNVDTAIPQVQVPVPLRSYPVPPTLLAQSGYPHEQLAPPVNPGQAIEQGKQWDYRVDFQGLNAAQDTDHLQVTFNAHEKKSSLTGVAADARTMRIFAALAKFMDVYATLLPDLTLLTGLPPGVYNKRAAVALQVFDTLVMGVVQAFRVTRDALAVGAEWPELLYEYQLQTQTANGLLKSLVLTQQKGPSGSNAPLWPRVLVQSLFGPTSATGPDAGFVELTFAGASGMVATYDYTEIVPSTQQLTQRFVFPKRNVIRNQNAWGGIYLTRNDDLIASGPLGWSDIAGATGPIAPVPTNQVFLYETPLVRFVDPTTPLLVDQNTIDVAGLTGQSASPRSLTAQIEAMLDAVLEWGAGSPVQADSYLSILCSYSFPLSGAGSQQEIVATVPVRLVPTRYLSSGGKSTFAAQLSASIQMWEGWPTRSANGFLVFDLKTFTVPVGASGPTEGLKPVLEFENLRIPVNAVSS